MNTPATTIIKLGSIFYEFWGLVHFQVSYHVYKVGENLHYSIAQAGVRATQQLAATEGW